MCRLASTHVILVVVKELVKRFCKDFSAKFPAYLLQAVCIILVFRVGMKAVSSNREYNNSNLKTTFYVNTLYVTELNLTI